MKYLLILLINLISISELYSQWHLKTTLNNNPPVVSVKTIDENVAWIAGFDGTVYRTIDGGENWNATLTKASTTESLGPIEALDENTAFVGGAGPDWSGGNTKIYRTTNGGQSWDSVYTAVGATSFWNWIHFFDSQNGIAQSDPPDGDTFLIVKTTDGGTTWSPISNLPAINSNEFGLLNSFFFYDDLNGWFGTGHPPFVAGGNAGRVFRTTDGGNTWTPFASGNGEDANAMEFTSPLIGIRTSITSPFLTRTTDGGQTWTAVTNLPISDIQIIINATSINTQSLSQIWIYGKTANKDFILTSTDEGLTWQEQNISGSFTDPLWHMSAVTYGALNDSVYALGITFNVNTFLSGGQIFNYQEPTGFITDIKEGRSNLLSGYTLSKNYPNPFNPSTKFEFRIADFGLVTLKVYDVLGNELSTLLNEEKPVGVYQVDFDGTNLSSGIYFYTLKTGGFVQTRKMILIK